MCNCKIGVVCEECLERNTTWKKAQHGLLKQRITELERRLTMTEQLRVGEVEEAKLEAMRHVATGCGLACRPRSNLDDLVTAIRQEKGRAVTEALEECCMALCTHCLCLRCGPEPGNAEMKPAVLIEGEWWHPVIWLPSGGAERVRCGAAAIRDSVQSLRKWYAF